VARPTNQRTRRRFAEDGLASFALLLVSLVAVIGLQAVLADARASCRRAGAPATIGIVIALFVLLPERGPPCAPRADRLQTSMNLALGSALASIGLTIPAVALSRLCSVCCSSRPGPKDLVLLLTSRSVRSRSAPHQRHETVHLVIFAAFVFLASCLEPAAPSPHGAAGSILD
jgi:Ca2+:H+ antiporter